MVCRRFGDSRCIPFGATEPLVRGASVQETDEPDWLGHPDLLPILMSLIGREYNGFAKAECVKHLASFVQHLPPQKQVVVQIVDSLCSAQLVVERPFCDEKICTQCAKLRSSYPPYVMHSEVRNAL